MLWLRIIQKGKARRQVIKYLGSLEVALLGRVRSTMGCEHRKEDTETLSRSVVDILLARPSNGDVEKHAVAVALASAIAGQDKQIRDSLFVSLRAMLVIAGDANDFVGERRILEKIFWLKQFGEMPSHSHDSDVLSFLAAELQLNTPLPAVLPSARN